MIAEFERKQIVERTKSSIRSAIKNNAKIHGGAVPLGFDKDPVKKGVWLPNKKELSQVKIIMEKFNEHVSYKSLLVELKEMGIKNKSGKDFNAPTLKRLLTNMKYMGKLNVPSDNNEEPVYVDLPFGEVIDKSLFEKVQENVAKVDKLRGFNKKRSRVYLLTGILQFEDGSRFTGHSGTARNGNPKYYYLNSKNNIKVPAEEVEGAVFDSLRMFEDNDKMIAHANQIKKDTFTKLDFILNPHNSSQIFC